MAQQQQQQQHSARDIPDGRSSFWSQWMRQSLDHFNMKTNMDEYGTTPPESESMFLHESKLPTTQSILVDGLKRPDNTFFRAKDLGLPRTPSSNCLSVVNSDHVCPSRSAPQSATTTPSVTPQQSPTLLRKILANSDLDGAPIGKRGADNGNSYISRLVPLSRVTNFDLNAVSPTSW